MTTRTLPLQLSKRAQRAMMFNHAIPGLVLIITGAGSLAEGWHEHSWIDLAGLLFGVTQIIVLARELKSKHAHAHKKIAWFEVITGVVIFLEGYHKLHPGKAFQPATMLMILGIVLFFIGLFHTKLPAIRLLTCTDEGFTVRTRPIRYFKGKWAEIKSFSLEGDKLLMRKSDDSLQKRSLRSIENRAEVLQILNEELATYQRKLADKA
jgi:uncharacterized membrane protein YgdD (TMEM256/DUF423 family)